MLKKTVIAFALISLSGVALAQDGRREQGSTSGYQCIAFQHRDYGGSTMSEYSGRGYKYVGSAWNDKISSFKIANGCWVKAYQHRDYKGDSTTFTGYVKYTGDLWNDQISSWTCHCR
jgi:hypothetical protein